MSVQTLKPTAYRRGRLEERLEFRAILAIALVLFAVTALVEQVLPARWHMNRGPGLAGILTAAKTASTFAFMG